MFSFSSWISSCNLYCSPNCPFQLKYLFAKTVHNILIFFSVSETSENKGSDPLSSSLSLPLPLSHQGDGSRKRLIHFTNILKQRQLLLWIFTVYFFFLLLLYWFYSFKNYLHLLNPLTSNLLLFCSYLEDYSFDCSSFSFHIQSFKAINFLLNTALAAFCKFLYIALFFAYNSLKISFFLFWPMCSF